MTLHYDAHGLHLTSEFSLPGVKAAPDIAADKTNVDGTNRPHLGLGMQRVDELELVWNSRNRLLLWDGQLGDGSRLTLEQGTDGDLMFSYGDRARFRLHADLRQLDCAPASAGAADWQRVLITKVIPSISVMRGYEALHAAVVDFPEGVVAIMGSSGAGKSTLAVELLRRGRPLFADDQLTFHETTSGVRAQPGTPHMNLACDLPIDIEPARLGSTLATLGDELWLVAHDTTSVARPVRAICLLRRGNGLALDVQRFSPNPLALAPYMLGLTTDIDRQRRRFQLYADLLESVILLRLTAGPEHSPVQLADQLEDMLLTARAPLAGRCA